MGVHVTSATPGEYGRTVRLRRRRGLMSNYFDQFFITDNCVTVQFPSLWCAQNTRPEDLLQVLKSGIELDPIVDSRSLEMLAVSGTDTTSCQYLRQRFHYRFPVTREIR